MSNCKTTTASDRELIQVQEFYLINFGLAKVPCWHNRWKELIGAICDLHTVKLGIHYDNYKPALYKVLRYRISKDYKIKYACIDLMLGLCLMDTANPWGILFDFFQQSNTKITRTQR